MCIHTTVIFLSNNKLPLFSRQLIELGINLFKSRISKCNTRAVGNEEEMRRKERKRIERERISFKRDCAHQQFKTTLSLLVISGYLSVCRWHRQLLYKQVQFLSQLPSNGVTLDTWGNFRQKS